MNTEKYKVKSQHPESFLNWQNKLCSLLKINFVHCGTNVENKKKEDNAKYRQN